MKDIDKKFYNKNILLIKKIVTAIFFIVSVLYFSSCSKPLETGKNPYFADFVLQQLLYEKSGVCSLSNPENLYYNKSVNNFLLRHIFTSGGIQYEFELLNPQYQGFIDSSLFYSAYTDNGEWVENTVELVYQQNSGDYEENFSFPRPFSVFGNPGEETVDAENAEELWIQSNNRINAVKFQDEIFMPVHKDENYVLINSSSQKTTRSFYDKNFVLKKRETWNITTPKDSKIVKNEIFNYDSDENLESAVTETETSTVTTFYNKNKQPARTDIYEKNGKNNYLTTRTMWLYTENGKISVEECAQYFYNEGDYSHFSDKITKRQTYSYKTDENIPPDYKYYENGKLKMRIVYSDQKNYVSQIYFDDNYSVTTYYIDNMKVKDVYVIDGQIKRVKEYD